MTAQRKKTSTDLVVGLGNTGLSVARYLKRSGRQAAFVDTREQPPGLEELKALWPDADIQLGDAKIPAGVGRVIVSPGVRDSHPLLAEARDAGLPVLSDIDLFVGEAEAPFVAITGTNGKSTVTTLVALMCEASGKRVVEGGNLGRPALDLLEEPVPDWYVLELSSFQLQRTAHLPAAVAVLLNISRDHLDWHANEAEYRAAKYRVYREAERAVFNRAEADVAEAASDVERRVGFALDEPPAEHYGRRLEDGRTYLARGESLLLDVGELAIYGLHNQANALAALAAGELMSLSSDAMLAVLCEFPGLPHRMQRVMRVESVDYIDDSKATNVAAAIASIDSIDGWLVLIAGGQGKGGDFTKLAGPLSDKLRAAVLIGTDAESIAEGIATQAPVHFATDMDDAVLKASRCAEPGDVVLLAPACASFDMFENYMARGDAFAEAARSLAS